MKSVIRRSTAVLGAAILGVAAFAGCSNEPIGGGGDGTAGGSDCSEFAGQTIDFVIPYDAGGGFDILARIIAPGLENALDATVVPINKPGAGGLLAINQLAVAPPDGKHIGIVNGLGAAGAIIAEADGPTFGFDDLSYIGRAAFDGVIITTNPDGEYTTWADVLASDGFRFGSTGRGSSDFAVANALIEAFDLKNAEVVTGFNGQPEVDLALLQGNVDAVAGPLDSARPHLQSGDEVGVLSFSPEPPEDAPDVTLVDDLDLEGDAATIIEGIKIIGEYGRPIVAPAGLEEGTRRCLQDALQTALDDPEVIAQAEKMQRDLSFMSGQEMTDIVIPSFDDLSPAFVDILKKSY